MILKILALLNQAIFTALITGLFLWVLLNVSPNLITLMPGVHEIVLKHPTYFRDNIMAMPIGPNRQNVESANIVYEMTGRAKVLVKTDLGHRMTLTTDDSYDLNFQIEKDTLINDKPYDPATIGQTLNSGQRILVKFSYNLRSFQWRTEKVNGL